MSSDIEATQMTGQEPVDSCMARNTVGAGGPSALDNEALIRAAYDAQTEMERALQRALAAVRDGLAVDDSIREHLASYETARAALASHVGLHEDAALSEIIEQIEQARSDALSRFASLQTRDMDRRWLEPLCAEARKLVERIDAGRSVDPAAGDHFLAMLELHDAATRGEASVEAAARLEGVMPQFQGAIALAAVGRLPLDDTSSSGPSVLAEEPCDDARAPEATPVPPSVSASEPEGPAVAEVNEWQQPDEHGEKAADVLEDRSTLTAVPDADGIVAASAPVEEREASEAPGEARRSKAASQERPLATQVSEQAVQTVIEMMEQSRFGLAFQIARAAEMPEAYGLAFELAAYAYGISSGMGPAAVALREHAELVVASSALGSHQGAKLIVAAAALRVATIAPHLGGAQVLGAYEAAVGDVPQYAQLCAVVRQLAEKGISITSDLVEQRTDIAALEAHMDELRQRARTLVTNPGTINYARATSLWRRIVQSQDHELGRALRAIQDDDAAARDRVSEMVASLRSRKALEAFIDDADGQRMRPSVKRRIDGVSRESLRLRILDVIDLAEGWVRTSQHLKRLGSRQGTAWLNQAMSELRGAAENARKAQPPAEWPAGDALTRAAGGVFAQAAERVVSLALDARQETVTERSADLLLGGDLLRDASMRLDAELRPIEPPALGALLALAGPADWQRSFDERAARRDHDLLLPIIEMLREQDAAAAEACQERRDALVAEARQTFERRHIAVGARLSSAYQRGALTPDQWQRWEVERAGLAIRDDDLAIGRKLDALERLDRLSGREAHEMVKRRGYELRADAARSDDPEVSRRVELALSAGDVATAEGVVLAASRKQPLPTETEHDRSLERWYPRVPDALREQFDAIEVGRRLAGGEEVCGLRPADLDKETASLISAAFESWPNLRAKEEPVLAAELTRVLRLLGLDVTKCQQALDRSAKDLRQYEIEARLVGGARVPHFGSKANGAYRVMLLSGADVAADRLIAGLEARGTTGATLLIHLGVLSPRQRQQFADLARTKRSETQAMLIDFATLVAVAALDPGRFEGLERATLPFTGLNPYVPYASGLVPAEIFYGRTDHLSDLLSADGRLAFIYGGRRLGKSALLRAAEREVRRTDKDVIARYLDLDNHGVGDWRRPETLFAIIEAELEDTLPRLSNAGMRRKPVDRLVTRVKQLLSQRRNARILLLLDECDGFIVTDAKEGFRTMAVLRDLQSSTDRRFRPIFAGLHNVRRFDDMPNHRSVHFGLAGSVGPLGPADARSLIERPLETLGYRLEEESIGRLLTLTQHQPSLIQLVCDELVKHMRSRARVPDTPPYTITHKDIEHVLALPDLAREIAARFELTISLDPRYKLIALLLAYLIDGREITNGFGVGELRSHCEDFWAAGFRETDLTEFEALLDEMEALGVLYAHEGLYSLRSPHVARMMGTQKQIEDRLLEAASAEHSDDTFSGRSYRYELPSSGESSKSRRSPLTLRQTEDLLRDVNGIYLIVGSSALSFALLPEAIASLSGRGEGCECLDAGGLSTEAGRKRFVRGLKNDLRGLHRIVSVVADGMDAETLRAKMEEARSVLQKRSAASSGSVCGVIAVDESGIAAWRTLVARWIKQGAQPPTKLMQLHRWDASGLRAWLLDQSSELPAVLEDDIDRLLTATGGWPMLVEQFVDSLGADKRVEAALEQTRERTRDVERAAAFVAATGVSRDPLVMLVWERLIEYEDPLAPAEGMVATLAELCDLSPVDAEATLDVMSALKLVDIDAKGALCCEPVLAAAWSATR